MVYSNLVVAGNVSGGVVGGASAGSGAGAPLPAPAELSARPVADTTRPGARAPAPSAELITLI